MFPTPCLANSTEWEGLSGSIVCWQPSYDYAHSMVVIVKFQTISVSLPVTARQFLPPRPF
jgi:hypothetical protein